MHPLQKKNRICTFFTTKFPHIVLFFLVRNTTSKYDYPLERVQCTHCPTLMGANAPSPTVLPLPLMVKDVTTMTLQLSSYITKFDSIYSSVYTNKEIIFFPICLVTHAK